MAHGSQRLTVKQNTRLQDFKIFLFVQLRFISNTYKIDSAYTTRTDAKGCAANGIDESIKFIGVAKKSTTITKHANIIANEEI